MTALLCIFTEQENIRFHETNRERIENESPENRFQQQQSLGHDLNQSDRFYFFNIWPFRYSNEDLANRIKNCQSRVIICPTLKKLSKGQQRL